MRSIHGAALFMLLMLSITGGAEARVTIDASEKGAIVEVDGALFAEYLIDTVDQPCLWPVIGPTGEPVTRAYPIDPDVEGESRDHPHHHSLWFSHGEVNGVDFWAGIAKSDSSERRARIIHREFVFLDEVGEDAKLVARNDWMDGDEKICEDERTFIFSANQDRRWIDFAVTLKATERDVEFGDTKEGSFAIRVSDTMKVNANRGGKIINREGLVNGEAWGMPSRWVDYSGPVGGEMVGIAMMSHPENSRPIVRWHVRTYGLFTANPFGEDDFPETGLKQGAITLRQGDELSLRYRVLLHRGDALEGDVEKVYRDYAGEPAE